MRIKSFRNAKIEAQQSALSKIDLSRYKNIILHFGGHDIYSASMKSYLFLNVDILKITKGIWTVTLHFVFLVNYRHA